MSIVKGCIIAAVALVAGAWVEAARADEAYICERGRVVYVKPGELETMKLQDPCVAGNFGQVPAATAPAPREALSAPATEVAKHQVAEPVSDFRNVRIINAEPGSDAWFKHRW